MRAFLRSVFRSGILWLEIIAVIHCLTCLPSSFSQAGRVSHSFADVNSYVFIVSTFMPELFIHIYRWQNSTGGGIASIYYTYKANNLTFYSLSVKSYSYMHKFALANGACLMHMCIRNIIYKLYDSYMWGYSPKKCTFELEMKHVYDNLCKRLLYNSVAAMTMGLLDSLLKATSWIQMKNQGLSIVKQTWFWREHC